MAWVPTANRHGWVLCTDGARAAVASIALTVRGGMRRGSGGAAVVAVAAWSSWPIGTGPLVCVMALTCPCSGVRVSGWRGARAGTRVLGPVAPGRALVAFAGARREAADSAS